MIRDYYEYWKREYQHVFPRTNGELAEYFIGLYLALMYIGAA
jgi:hypothetical protein